MERFPLNLKVERVWQKDYANHAEAITDIADYTVNFYNAVRLHSTLGNLSPIAFDHQSASEKLIALSELTSPPHARVVNSTGTRSKATTWIPETPKLVTTQPSVD